MGESIREKLAILPEEPRRHSPFYNFFRGLVREKPLGTVGAVIVLLLLFTAIFADLLAPYGMNEAHIADRLDPPSAKYILGTDNLGRDILSRIIYGARISMYVGLGASALLTAVATFIGGISGFFGGKTDLAIQRFVDAFMCFPYLVIYLSIMAILGPGLIQVILVLGIVDGIGMSRIIRGAVIGIKENIYMEAARAIGCSTGRILTRHVLPNIAAPIMIVFTTQCGYMIIGEAALSFLGFGIPPPAPSWGGMLSGTGRHYMYIAPWMALWPGLALSLVVYGLNMFGDAVRDLLDPRLKGGAGGYTRMKRIKAKVASAEKSQ
jgi:peptide/nickel transport system permease protein